MQDPNSKKSTETAKRRTQKLVCAIVATDEEGVIGANNSIPWKIPGEQRIFKDLTMGNPLIMGRRTYDSIGRPLPGRKSIILTRAGMAPIPGVTICHTVDEALDVADAMEGKEICIGGGQEIYELCMPYTDRIYLTVVHARVDGDRRFPPFKHLGFRCTHSEDVEASIPYTFSVYDREP
jgi:dihydrofolate reductase